jgi:hypothetical protein
LRLHLELPSELGFEKHTHTRDARKNGRPEEAGRLTGSVRTMLTKYQSPSEQKPGNIGKGQSKELSKSKEGREGGSRWSMAQAMNCELRF